MLTKEYADVQMLKALADAMRIQILQLLAKKDMDNKYTKLPGESLLYLGRIESNSNLS